MDQYAKQAIDYIKMIEKSMENMDGEETWA